MKKNQELKLQELKEFFKLDKLTIEDWHDCYGNGVNIKEIGLSCYKRDLELSIQEIMDQYNFALSCVAEQMLQEVAKKDNMYANYLSKREYEIVKVFMSKSCVRFGVTIRFKDNGETRHFIETGLDYALHDYEKMYEYVNRDVHYFTAGGLNDEDVDFIFHGVGHCTKKEMYCRDDNELFVCENNK